MQVGRGQNIELRLEILKVFEFLAVRSIHGLQIHLVVITYMYLVSSRLTCIEISLIPANG